RCPIQLYPLSLHDALPIFLVPRLDEKSVKVEVLATGLPASPGAAVGQIVFTADEAVEKAGHERKKNPVILVRAETTPEDIHGMRSEEHTSELQSPCNFVCR